MVLAVLLLFAGVGGTVVEIGAAACAVAGLLAWLNADALFHWLSPSMSQASRSGSEESRIAVIGLSFVILLVFCVLIARIVQKPVNSPISTEEPRAASTAAKEKHIPGLQAVNVHGNFTKKGFRLEKDFTPAFRILALRFLNSTYGVALKKQPSTS